MSLIETLIYFSLLSLLIIGIMGTSFATSFSNTQMRALSQAAREGDFIIHTLNNLLSLHSIIKPGSSNQMNVIEVVDEQNNNEIITVFSDANRLWIKHGNGLSMPISANTTTVTHFQTLYDSNQQTMTVSFVIYGQLFSVSRATSF